jgi:hypothetical protein
MPGNVSQTLKKIVLSAGKTAYFFTIISRKGGGVFVYHVSCNYLGGNAAASNVEKNSIFL